LDDTVVDVDGILGDALAIWSCHIVVLLEERLPEEWLLLEEQ